MLRSSECWSGEGWRFTFEISFLLHFLYLLVPPDSDLSLSHSFGVPHCNIPLRSP